MQLRGSPTDISSRRVRRPVLWANSGAKQRPLAAALGAAVLLTTAGCSIGRRGEEKRALGSLKTNATPLCRKYARAVERFESLPLPARSSDAELRQLLDSGVAQTRALSRLESAPSIQRPFDRLVAELDSRDHFLQITLAMVRAGGRIPEDQWAELRGAIRDAASAADIRACARTADLPSQR